MNPTQLWFLICSILNPIESDELFVRSIFKHGFAQGRFPRWNFTLMSWNYETDEKYAFLLQKWGSQNAGMCWFQWSVSHKHVFKLDTIQHPNACVEVDTIVHAILQCRLFIVTVLLSPVPLRLVRHPGCDTTTGGGNANVDVVASWSMPPGGFLGKGLLYISLWCDSGLHTEHIGASRLARKLREARLND